MTDLTDASTLRPSVVAAHRDHFVHFYDHDAALVEAVESYLRQGLESGAGAIAIATAEHQRQLLDEWARRGFDAPGALRSGQLVFLDAAQTLASLSVDGWPQARLFEEKIGTLVGDASRRFGSVVAFGEMVALLWIAGRHSAAIQLEGFWSALVHKHEFKWYCAYPMSECATSEVGDAFRDVCHAHGRVIPASTDAAAGDLSGHALAQLQQNAAALAHEIAVRKRVESLLADRERELSDFLENAVVGLHRVGPDGTILWANRAELAMLGYASSEYIGRNIMDFYCDKSTAQRLLARLGEGETVHDFAARMRCKDGSVRHVLVSSNALREEGKLVSTRCFTRDVSDRWQAQEALRDRGAVLHLALQGARMGYWIGDLERDTLRCSHELAGLLGLSGTLDWTIDAFLALMHPEDRGGFRSALSQAVEGRTEFRAEFRVRHELSDWHWFEARGEGTYDADGIARRFYGVCADITGRKRQERMLAHLAAVIDSAEDAIISKTLDGIVTSWNAGAQRIFGYEAGEIVGRPVTVLIPPPLMHEEAQILAKLRAGERIEHYETVRVAKDGSSKRISLSVSPIRDLAGRIVGASKIARELR